MYSKPITYFFVLLALAIISGCGAIHKRDLSSDDRIKAEVQYQKRLQVERERLARIEKEERRNRVSKIAARLNAATYGVCRELTNDARTSCTISVQVVESETVNAYADGKVAYIHKGIIDFTRGRDEELAIIIGHEMAHNFLNHLDKKQTNGLIGRIIGAAIQAGTGVDATDLFEQLGQLVYSQEFEAESDYVGLYLVARAGYDYTKSPELWRRMDGTPVAAVLSTHPGNAERFLELDATVAEIHDKQLFGLDVMPDKKGENVVLAHIEKYGYNALPEEKRSPPNQVISVYGINSYTPPKKKQVLGKWSGKVEDLALSKGCLGENGQKPIASFVSSKYSTETYSISCSTGLKITALCEYGDCYLQN